MPQKDASFRLMAKPDLASRRVEGVVLLLAWLLFLILTLRAFGPDSLYTNFTSDCAIPILMANDDRPLTVFDTYYYAVDRYGAWPFMIGRVLHQNFGIHWTDQTLHYTKTIWLFLGLLILAALNVRAAPAVLLSALIALSLEPTSRRLIFDLGQLYAWQLPPLFLAWFCLRRLLAVRVQGIIWGASFFLAAFFAIWTSVASAALLAVLLTLEALRSHFLFKKTITTRRIALAAVLLLTATICEFLMKMNYYRHTLKHFGQVYKTAMEFDFAYLYENLVNNWHNVVQFKMFYLIVVALGFFVGTVGLILHARLAGKAVLTRVISFFEDETVTMIIALSAMAAMNFVIMISVSHVRLNFYNVRFHALTYLFGSIAGLLTIYFAIRVLAHRLRVTRYVVPTVLAGAYLLLGIYFPPRVQSEAYKVDRETALALSQKAPGTILIGGYWETYLFAGLQPTNTMTPLPFEGILNRMPWTSAMLNDSPQVVLEYRNSGLVQQESSPPNELVQYGNLLKLRDARFYENGPYAFALYFNERMKPLVRTRSQNVVAKTRHKKHKIRQESTRSSE